MTIPTSLNAHLDRLFTLATELEQLMEATADDLPHKTWELLNEAAVRLRAYAGLIHTDSPQQFLQAERDDAARLLDATRDEARQYGWFQEGGAA